MKSLALLAGGLLAGYFAGASAGHSLALARADFEWARMLENHMVGPTQTAHPLRGGR